MTGIALIIVGLFMVIFGVSYVQYATTVEFLKQHPIEVSVTNG